MTAYKSILCAAIYSNLDNEVFYTASVSAALLYHSCIPPFHLQLSLWWRVDVPWHCRQDWPVLEDGSKADRADVDTSGNHDVTDSYLVARYAWHQDVLKQVVNDEAAKAR